MNDLQKPNPDNIITSEDDLSRVVRKALSEIEDILDIDLSTVKEKEQVKVLAIKKDAATAIINAGLKADENRFRRENKDIIDRLFTKIRKDSKIINGEIVHRS